MTGAGEYAVRLRCTECRWTDVAYSAGHHRSQIKLGHKVNRDPALGRCSGTVEVVTDDPDYPKGATHA